MRNVGTTVIVRSFYGNAQGIVTGDPYLDGVRFVGDGGGVGGGIGAAAERVAGFDIHITKQRINVSNIECFGHSVRLQYIMKVDMPFKGWFATNINVQSGTLYSTTRSATSACF